MNLFKFAEKNKNDLKKIPNSDGGLSLEKSAISLEKSLVRLEKKSGVDFGSHKAKVAVVLDYSGSMSILYRYGAIQRLLTQLMPLALRFDDDGELDVWLFNDFSRRVASMKLSNYDSYVDQEIIKKGYSMGGTSYAPALKDVLNKYFIEEVETKVPAFVIFITDGTNNDKEETDKVIRESASENIFIQFVGIGHEKFDYLEKLDNLSGRTVDNTGFIKVADMEKLTDEQLYDLLLDQYPDWLKNKGIL